MAPCLDAARLESAVRRVPGAQRLPLRFVVGGGVPALAACDVALLKPGTATLEATLPAGFAVEEVGQDGVDDQGNRLPAFLRIIATAEAARDGRSYSAVAEGSVTQLDTQAETARGALGYLRDLKDGDYLFGGKSPSLVDASIRDIMRLQPGRKHSRAQKLAASRVQIRMSADKAEATISLRGTPSVGFDRWLSIESRSGNARPPSLRSDQGFADTDYGRRLEDFRNMTEKSQSQKGGRFLQTFNADFARKVRGDGHPPDGWQVDSPDIGGSPAVSVWNGDILFDATTTLSGGQAVKFLNTDAFLRSDLVSIQGGSLPYTVEMTILRKTGDPSFLVGQILWYDVGGVFIPPASPNFVISASTTGVFETRRTRAEIAPATARFAAVQVRAFDAGGGLPFDQAWLDQATIIRTSREWRATFQDETSQKLNTKDAYQLVTLDEEIRDFGENFATGTSSATCTEDGLYVIGGGIYVDKNGGTLVYVQAKVEIDRGPGFVDLICGSTGADPAGDREARDHVFDDVELEKGDVLRLQARADWSGSKPSLVRGEFNTYLFGKLKSTD